MPSPIDLLAAGARFAAPGVEAEGLALALELWGAAARRGGDGAAGTGPSLALAVSCAATEPATDWLGALGPDDLVAPGGAEALRAAAARGEADAIFFDDVVMGGAGSGPGARLRAKPSFDPLLLASLDYIGRAAIFRREALGAEDAAALAAGAPPAAILRRRPDLRVRHLAYPAALLAGADEGGAGATPARPATEPVGIVIPNRDSPALIARVLDGVLNHTSGDLSVVVVDNGSTSAETLALYESLRGDPRVRVAIEPAPFNFSVMVNRGVALTERERVLLLNNDVEVIAPGWLDEMAAVLAAPGVGVVGAKLLFPDRTVQHAGVIVGHGGVAGHDLKGAAEGEGGLLGRMRFPHMRSAVTAAAMLTTRSLWDRLGGFDERAFAVAFNDVDFCLRARAAGAGVAMAPAATLIHHEGRSRRGGVSASRARRQWRERAALRRRHGTVGMVDPFESPWRDHDDLSPNLRRRAPVPGLR